MRLALLTAILAFALAAVLGGAAPFGRVLMALGVHDAAGPLFKDPAWRGAAAYRAGRFEAAAEEFQAASALFNLGNAHTGAGRYAAALEAYDLALAQGEDAQARANSDLVRAFYAGRAIDPEALGLLPERKSGPDAESFVARGDARAAGSGSEVTNANTMLGLAELDSRGRLGVRRVFDDAYMIANVRWLAQLEDIPGAFLKARIAQEHKRRQKLGLSPGAEAAGE